MTLRSAIITGTANININGTVGATTPNTGVFTTIAGTDTTDATSTTAAAVKTAGGLAVVKQIYVGDNVVPAAAKGMNFSGNTPQAGMTSQLLNWYEEGTWTPNQGGGLVVVGAFSSSGKYTRIGRQVTLLGQVNGATSIAIAAGATLTTNAPFTSTNTPLGIFVNGAQTVSSGCIMASTTIYSVQAVAAGPSIYFEIMYFI